MRGGGAATAAGTVAQHAQTEAGATELYVYYRVDVSAASEAMAAARDCQQRLCAAHPGLQARLLVRQDGAAAPLQPGLAGQQQTWMETYHFVPGSYAPGVDAALQAEIEAMVQASPLSRYTLGPRHLERFCPCA